MNIDHVSGLKMLKSIVIGGAVLLAISNVAQAAGTGSTVTFQGEGFVTVVPSACGTAAAVGDFYRLVYRSKVASSDPADAVTFFGSRSAFRILSTASSGSLNGAATTSNAYIDSRSDFNSGVAGSASLNFTPFTPGTPIANSPCIRLTGTVNNFYGVAGCNITVRAVLTIRPD